MCVCVCKVFEGDCAKSLDFSIFNFALKLFHLRETHSIPGLESGFTKESEKKAFDVFLLTPRHLGFFREENV